MHYYENSLCVLQNHLKCNKHVDCGLSRHEKTLTAFFFWLRYFPFYRRILYFDFEGKWTLLLLILHSSFFVWVLSIYTHWSVNFYPSFLKIQLRKLVFFPKDTEKAIIFCTGGRFLFYVILMFSLFLLILFFSSFLHLSSPVPQFYSIRVLSSFPFSSNKMLTFFF
jgi:hypothetical protein